MKTQKNTKKIYNIILAIVLLSSCHPDTVSTTTVYTAGFTVDNNYRIPCYWIDRDRKDLPVLAPTKDGEARAIQVVKNDAYVAGFTTTVGGDRVPCYWLNGERVDLSVLDPGKSGEANDIQIVGSAIFTAGYTASISNYKIPCYWLNGERVDLPVLDPEKHGEVKAIAVVNNTVYTAGYIINDADITVPCYWINDTLIILPTPDIDKYGEAHDIQVAGNNIYIAGFTLNYINDDAIKERPCYWLNGTRTDIPPPPTLQEEDHQQAHAIQIEESNVYTAGYYRKADDNIKRACYWINDTRIELPFTGPEMSSGGEVRALQLVGKTVYTAGYSENNSGNSAPCYWVNYYLRMTLPVLNSDQGGQVYAVHVIQE